jgi:hypothetical protein
VANPKASLAQPAPERRVRRSIPEPPARRQANSVHRSRERLWPWTERNVASLSPPALQYVRNGPGAHRTRGRQRPGPLCELPATPSCRYSGPEWAVPSGSAAGLARSRRHRSEAENDVTQRPLPTWGVAMARTPRPSGAIHRDGVGAHEADTYALPERAVGRASGATLYGVCPAYTDRIWPPATRVWGDLACRHARWSRRLALMPRPGERRARSHR